MLIRNNLDTMIIRVSNDDVSLSVDSYSRRLSELSLHDSKLSEFAVVDHLCPLDLRSARRVHRVGFGVIEVAVVEKTEAGLNADRPFVVLVEGLAGERTKRLARTFEVVLWPEEVRIREGVIRDAAHRRNAVRLRRRSSKRLKINI